MSNRNQTRISQIKFRPNFISHPLQTQVSSPLVLSPLISYPVVSAMFSCSQLHPDNLVVLYNFGYSSRCQACFYQNSPYSCSHFTEELITTTRLVLTILREELPYMD